MQSASSKNSPLSPKNWVSAMTTATSVQIEMRERVTELLGYAHPMVKVALGRLSQRLGLEPGRVRNLYHGTARRIDAWEADRVRGLHMQMEHLKEKQAQIDAEVAALLGRTHDATVDRSGNDALALGAHEYTDDPSQQNSAETIVPSGRVPALGDPA